MMFVVMEGLTSTISVLSLTILASSGGETKSGVLRLNQTFEEATQTRDGEDMMAETQGLVREQSDLLFSCSTAKDHNNVTNAMSTTFPNSDMQSAVAFDLKRLLSEVVMVYHSVRVDSMSGCGRTSGSS